MAGALNTSARIVGSGKMARDIGLHLVLNDFDVTWLSRDLSRLADLEKHVSKKVARLDRILDSASPRGACGFALLGSPDIPAAELVFECGLEDLDNKRSSVLAAELGCGDRALVLSNSSSIFPWDIGSCVVGMHFFYPVALTSFVELIFPEGCDEETKERVRTLANELSLRYLEEGSSNAFLVNRSLLPLMAEVFRLLRLGYDIGELDRCSMSPLLKIGQITLMDEIGLDVLSASVARYVARMPDREAEEYMRLCDILASLVDAGFLGKKNRSALLASGEGVIEIAGRASLGFSKNSTYGDPAKNLYYLFLNTCYTFAERGECDVESLSSCLSSIFGADFGLDDALRVAGPSSVVEHLEALYTETGISYFRPSRLLRVAAGVRD